VARGWESKSVEAQQADRQQGTRPAPELTPEESARAARKKTLELTRARATADLALARTPAHRAMLEAAIQALNEQLAKLVPVLLLLLLSACSLRDAACGTARNDVVAVPDAPSATAPVDPSVGAQVRVAFLGDSLTAGYGLLSQQAYPQVLQDMLEAEGYHIEAVNAGMSGDTSAGGLRRVEPLLDGSTRILVIALGANDALRGLTTQQTHDNLARIIDVALGKNVYVLLCGMEAPANYGPDYRDAFRQVYVSLLREYQGKISFVPFLLEGVAGDPALNQADGIHPTAEGAKIVGKTLYPKLRDLVDRIG
jgi:acyl-CoA thioesterase I